MIPKTELAGMPAAPHARADACLNCATPAPGHFCPACGQATHEHVPSATEFLHEFVGHYVALEGKLWGTLGRLLFRPGALTNEYIAGRRVRYVEPLRIYLTMSILFFALIRLSGSPSIETEATAPANHAAASAQASAQAQAQAAQPAVAPLPATLPKELREKVAAAQAAAAAKAARSAAAAASGVASDADSDADSDTIDNSSVMNYLDAHAKPIAKRFRHLTSLPHDEQRRLLVEGFFHYAPYAMFCLMPVFALYLKVLYLGSGRRYGEHFLFALHSNAFAFLMFALIAVAPGGFVKFLLVLWLLGYLPWAMKRVYRRSRLGTLGRWLLLATGHAVTIGLALLGVVAYSVLH